MKNEWSARRSRKCHRIHLVIPIIHVAAISCMAPELAFSKFECVTASACTLEWSAVHVPYVPLQDFIVLVLVAAKTKWNVGV